MKKFKAMKFWVGDDKNLSLCLQKHLFNLGYCWRNGDHDVTKNNISCVFTDKDGDMTVMYIAKDRKYFNEQSNREINIDWMRNNNNKDCIEKEIEGLLRRLERLEIKADEESVESDIDDWLLAMLDCRKSVLSC